MIEQYKEDLSKKRRLASDVHLILVSIGHVNIGRPGTATVFLLFSIHPWIMKKNKNSELKAGKRTACALSLVVKLYVRNVHIKLDYQSKGTSLILHDNRW